MILLIAAAVASAQPACPAAETPDAHVCRALQASGSGDHASGAAAFERAAQASPDGPARSRALAAAGNLWLAAGEHGKAALALDRALIGTGLRAEQRGEALLDRARVAEAQNELKTARTHVEQAVETIADDPFLWYFSAALAIREGDKAKAQSAIDKALSLAPTDPTILFEAGHVAQFNDDNERARSYWRDAQRYGSGGPIGKAAQEALAMLPASTVPAPQGR
jgi:tetratricopeptide (TPR) repeat protein